ncbi:EcsC family protein [Alkanindiges illinoisensis]|uniref:EcsC family protein n=1 Tax=Alkanindiges illinoisensis TaxID=197183 RepID=A0A4Y7XE05_9GAMM|nr:EcsC family protein [Alkanindiges illinoisensis]TEU29390.1 hypothetical protein E2B99_04875 [Alkanindiges illinoisensis]
MTVSVNSAQTKQSSPDFKDGFAQNLPTSMAKASPDLFDSLRARSKSLSDMGQNLLKQLAKNSVSRLTEIPEANSVINMTTDNQTPSNSSSTLKAPNRANQLFRQQLPGITKQVLGKRFNTVNKLANLVMPAGSFDKVSDQILELLADFASTVSASDHIIDEAGVKTLAELQDDTARSGRLARALNEKNRYIGMAQGAISGATGVAGAAADIPLSMILALRTVYLTGRAYGFELNQPEDRAMIFEALSNADLSLITEKQAILIGLNSVSGMLGTGNIQGLQAMLGSTNDFEPLFKLLSDSNGQLKWRISAALLDKVTPVIGGAVGAIYTSRLLKEVSESAKQVFEHARQQSAGQGISQNTSQQAVSQQPLKIEDKLPNPETPASQEEQAAQKEAQEALLHNQDIAKVEVSTRSEHDAQQVDEATKDEQIHDQLSALADAMIDDNADNQASQGDDSSQDSKGPNASAQEGDSDASAEDSTAQDTAPKKTTRTSKAKSAADTDESTAKASTAQDTNSKADGKADSAKPARRSTRKTGNSAASSTATADNVQASANTKH